LHLDGVPSYRAPYLGGFFSLHFICQERILVSEIPCHFLGTNLPPPPISATVPIGYSSRDCVLEASTQQHKHTPL